MQVRPSLDSKNVEFSKKRENLHSTRHSFGLSLDCEHFSEVVVAGEKAEKRLLKQKLSASNVLVLRGISGLLFTVFLDSG